MGAYEAKTRLSYLLEEVEAGSIVTITKHGRPVARLIGVDTSTTPIDVVLDELHRQRVPRRPGDPSVRAMIAEGRR
ncbi:prevent-host-death family protein [Mumia flava]|uniref:Antitoxin n=1 Tax=Mumia flava TaxID=1348852 RepID=A0A2M9AQ93_9ACTN|nr:prevent-host-death family protein [Mumia flava]